MIVHLTDGSGVALCGETFHPACSGHPGITCTECSKLLHSPIRLPRRVDRPWCLVCGTPRPNHWNGCREAT